MEEASTVQALTRAPLLPRERLIECGVAEFADKGFHGTTTRDISLRAGLSAAAMYVHFQSKEALLCEIIREAHGAALRMMYEAASEDSPAPERFGSLVRALAHFHAEHATVARIANYELRALSNECRATVLEQRRAGAQLIKAAIVEGIESGDFAVVDVDRMTIFVSSTAIGISRWYKPSGQLTPAQIADEYVDIALRMVGFR
jgi:AcrR family transcriptional regulator